VILSKEQQSHGFSQEASALRRSRLDETVAKGHEIVKIVQALTQEALGNSEDAALVACGKIREIAQPYRLAEACYRDALRVNPGNLEALARLAIAYMKNGNVGRALSIAAELTDRKPRFVFKDISGQPVSAMTVLGDAYRSADDLHRAKGAYEAALKLEPADAHSAIFLAQILADDGQLDKAAEIATSAGGHVAIQLQATLRLLGKDPNGLPAIVGIVSDRVSVAAMHI